MSQWVKFWQGLWFRAIWRGVLSYSGLGKTVLLKLKDQNPIYFPLNIIQDQFSQTGRVRRSYKKSSDSGGLQDRWQWASGESSMHSLNRAKFSVTAHDTLDKENSANIWFSTLVSLDPDSFSLYLVLLLLDPDPFRWIQIHSDWNWIHCCWIWVCCCWILICCH